MVSATMMGKSYKNGSSDGEFSLMILKTMQKKFNFSFSMQVPLTYLSRM